MKHNNAAEMTIKKTQIAFKTRRKSCFFAVRMSLFIASLNSGSNGNCYYIGNNEEAVLIDAGISCRETEIRMRRLQLSIEKTKAVFISHEHSDHITGLRALSKKYNLPVYITEATQRGCGALDSDTPLLPFLPFQPVAIGALRITAFPKLHDAADPHSFLISNGDVTVGVFTDIGFACQHVVHHFKQCDAAFLEANYDETILAQGKYPPHLKKRISGSKGHLSNQQALALFTRHKAPFMSHLLLAHLSNENNHPQWVKDLFTQQAGSTKIIVASRFRETEVFEIKKLPFETGEYRLAQRPFTAPLQLSLF